MKTLSDPVEIIIADALRGAGIDYVTAIDPRALHLDFYVPSLDLHIEVKQFHCDWTADQIQRTYPRSELRHLTDFATTGPTASSSSSGLTPRADGNGEKR